MTIPRRAGYVGMEKDRDRCHIVDIAVRKSYRRQRIGELLLRSMIEQALQFRADYLTLEVRVSNRLAQTLYTKYGFSIVERRSNYYVDKLGQQEDGYYMATGRITSPSYQALWDQLKPTTPNADARVATR
ncbi:MAG: ribosomal-protein-alanine acetyltransferase [Dehalococcoidia bacterium]|nr:ribosomal-protein-alanine acetyltransferase [Dehalococcoidia bacterium]